MKHYQSLINKPNKFQSLQNNKGLQPIMQYDYYFQSTKNQSKNPNNKILNVTKNTQKNTNKKPINKPINATQSQNKDTKQIKNSQQLNNKLYSAQNRQNQHFTKRTNQKSPLNNKNAKKSNKMTQKIQVQTQKPHKQSKILSQHNPTTYSSTLFPQPQSIKQKLKQNLQQQMLNNYYINKFSTIMSKMTNENIKIELPPDLTQRSSFSNTKDNQSLMGNKKRKNFKQVMRQKATTSKKNFNVQHNQSQGKMNKPNNFQYQTQDSNHHLLNKKRDESLLITFSPIKTPTIDRKNQKNVSKQSISVKSVNKNHKNGEKNNKDQKLTSSRHSHYSHTSSKSQSHQDRSSNNFSSQKQRKNNDSLRQSQKIRQSSHSFKTINFQSRQHSPQNRLNFKKSLKDKKSLYLEYEQNYNLYKKLQSSIIDELYSPSPRKIQKDKFKQIAFVNRQMTKQQKKLIKLKEKQGIKDFYDEGFQNIEINQDEFDFDKLEAQFQKQRQGEKDYYQRTRQIDLLRQSIRKSIQQSRNRSEMNSPGIMYDQKSEQKKSPSRKTPNDSPQRSFISNKYKNEQSQGSLEKQGKWNPHFNSVNSHNKKYLNMQSSRKYRGQSSSPSLKGDERKYHSLEKTYSPKAQKISPLKRLSSKLKNYQFSQQKLPINEQENQFQSDLQNNLQTTTQHNESYNEVAKVLGNSMDMTEDAHKHVSSKPNQRKGSFHSVRSDRNYRKQQPVQSRFIVENFHNSRNSNQTVNEPSEQEDDVEFVPAANQNLFSEKGSQRQKSKKSSPVRKNLIETVGHTRSRKPSQNFSFISDSNSHHDFSMLSRFSMTSEQGSVIVHKLQNEITENQFGPYQHALQSLRQLLYQHKTAWPIYVVGQKILDDRTQYEKKIELQTRMIQDYKQKIHELKIKQEKYENQNDQIQSNQIKILRLIRQLCL